MSITKAFTIPRYAVTIAIIAMSSGMGTTSLHASSIFYGLEDQWQVFAGNAQQPPTGGTGFVQSPDPLVETNLTATGTNGLSTASSTWSLSSSYGNLSVSGSATATNSADGGEFAGFSADPSAFYQDDITVVSSTLAAGTPVQIELTEVFDSAISQSNNSGSGGASAVDQLRVTDGLNSNVWNAELDSSGSMTTIVTTAVGQRLNFFGSLIVSGDADANFSSGLGPTTTASISITASGPLYVNVLTAGASFTSESGATYLAPDAPEPASLFLMGVGMAGIFGLLRYRNRLS